MKNSRILLFSFLVALAGMLPQAAQATHVIGGQITYDCQTACTYTIYQTTFMDCGSFGTPAPGGIPAAPIISFQGIGPGCSQPLAVSPWILVSYTEITPICATMATNCTNSSSMIYGQMEAVYKRDYNFCVTGACNQYDVSWSSCCRNSVLTSGSANSAIYLDARIDLSYSPCNNSPYFTSSPVAYICAGTGAVISQAAFDPDGDSLIYYLGNCMHSNGTPVGYNPGYSATSPLGPGWSVSLDYVTGTLTILPGTGGIVSGSVCIYVDEYKNGNFVGTINRDMQVNVLSCTGSNSLPAADSAFVLSGGNTIGAWHFSMCENDTLEFQLNASDANSSQSLSFSVPSSMPGLQLSSSSGSNPASALIRFAPGQSRHYIIPVTITDDNCPIKGYYTQNIHVSVGGACLSAVITDAACGQASGAIDLTVGGGSAPFSFAWSNGATTEDLTGLIPGGYTVVVTDANGFTFSKSYIVNASNIIVTSSINQPTCSGLGSLAVTPAGGTAPYSYSWSTGATTSSISNLAPGGYSVTVTDANGCPRHLAFVLSPPSSCYNVVRGTVYNDANGNCIMDAGESPMPYRVVNFSPGGATTTGPNGEYEYHLQAGNFDIEVYPGRWQQVLCPTGGKHSVSFANVGNVQNGLDFAIHTDSVQELSVSHYHQRVKVGDTTYHYLRVFNNGNKTMSGTLNWEHDTIFDIVTTTPAMSSYNAATHTASWNFFNLAPYQSIAYRVETSTDSTLGLGVWFTNTAVVLPLIGDSIPSNNVATRTDTTRGPYDPNDKIVTPAGTGPLGLIEQSERQMTYTIRFQNTGTDTAIYVVVRDTIDRHMLDVMSFQRLDESFPYSLNIENDEVLVFRFNKIMLPDSATDFNGSQGFVTFGMSHKGTLPIGSQIRNRAAIYFDFNAPIITNEVLNTVFAYPGLALGNDTTICEGQDILARITSPGLPPYDFAWSDGSSDLNNTSGLSSTTVNGSGNYQVTVTDALGISVNTSVLVTAAPLAEAAFSHTPVGLRVAFTNNSSVNSSWQWDFGDGQTASGSQAAVHTYAKGELYTVTLIVSNDCGSDTLTQQIDLRNVALDDALFAQSVKLVPHPVQDISYLQFANPHHESFRLRILDLQGRLVQEYPATQGERFEILRKDMTAGIYMYELIGERSYFGKLVIR